MKRGPGYVFINNIKIFLWAYTCTCFEISEFFRPCLLVFYSSRSKAASWLQPSFAVQLTGSWSEQLRWQAFISARTSTMIRTRHGTGSLGRRVNGSFGSYFTSGSPGHRVIILIRCETPVFPGFRKNARNAKRTFEMLK